MQQEKETPGEKPFTWKVIEDDRNWVDVIHVKEKERVYDTPLRCDAIYPDYRVHLPQVIFDPDDKRVILEPFKQKTYRRAVEVKTSNGTITNLSVVVRNEKDVSSIRIKYKHEEKERVYEFRDKAVTTENNLGGATWDPGVEPELYLLSDYFNELGKKLGLETAIGITRLRDELANKEGWDARKIYESSH